MLMKAEVPLKVTEVPILSPPEQWVTLMKAAHMLKATDVLIVLPLVQKVVTLKVSIPYRVSETPIITPLIQHVTSLWIASPTRIITSPVNSRLKPISDFSFFWYPETNEMSGVAPKFSFFWDPEAIKNNEVASKSASPVENLLASVPILLITCKVTSAPVQCLVSACHCPISNHRNFNRLAYTDRCDLLFFLTEVDPNLVSKHNFTAIIADQLQRKSPFFHRSK